MGDRTTVNIELRKTDLKALEGKFPNEVKEVLKYCSKYEYNTNDKIIEYTEEECNYARSDLEGLLKDHQIEYDKTWGAGGEYTGGVSYARWVDGVYQEHETYESDSSYEDLLGTLKKMIDDKKDIVTYILEKHLEAYPYEIRPLDEPNSVKFIKDEE